MQHPTCAFPSLSTRVAGEGAWTAPTRDSALRKFFPGSRHRGASRHKVASRLPNLVPFQGLWVLTQRKKPCHREVDRPLNESVVPPHGRTALEPDADYMLDSPVSLQLHSWETP